MRLAIKLATIINIVELIVSVLDRDVASAPLTAIGVVSAILFLEITKDH